MEHPLWDRIPADVRQRVDELLARQRKLQAITAIRDNVEDPRPHLYECMDLLVARCAELGEPWIRPSEPLDIDRLAATVAALPHPPHAIEAYWDGDTSGWFVCLAAVSAPPPTERTLALIRFGGDIRLFNGEVPPWPEAQEATAVGTALADRLGIPFWFASPDEALDDAPRWWDERA